MPGSLPLQAPHGGGWPRSSVSWGPGSHTSVTRRPCSAAASPTPIPACGITIRLSDRSGEAEPFAKRPSHLQPRLNRTKMGEQRNSGTYRPTKGHHRLCSQKYTTQKSHGFRSRRRGRSQERLALPCLPAPGRRSEDNLERLRLRFFEGPSLKCSRNCPALT